MKDEETLALKIEELNKKLDIIINEQQNIKKEMRTNKVSIMKRINKLHEYNDIDEMKNFILNDHINKIAKVIIELEKRLY